MTEPLMLPYESSGYSIDDESLQMPAPYTESNANRYMYIEKETVDKQC